MATEGSVYARKDGNWCAKYKDAQGTWRYLYAKTKAEVRRKLRQALKDKDDGIVPSAKLIEVGVYLAEWLENHRGAVSERTHLNTENIVHKHINPQIGSLKLSEVSGRDFHRLYGQTLSEGLAASTVKRIHVILNQALGDAVKSRYISRNPIADVRPPRQPRREIKVLTPEQVKQLLESVDGNRYGVIVTLGAMCGLRIGEALSLRYEDIDFDKGTLKVRRTLWRNQVYPPKTPHSRRTIKLPRIALDALKRHAQKNGNTNEGWLFSTRHGNPLSASNFHTCGWKPILAKAGLPTTLTYHQLRHGAASLLLSRKVPIPVISKYLGHANPGITMSLYAHMLDDDDGLAGRAMDDLFS